MQFFVALLVLLYCGVAVSANDIIEQLHNQEEPSISNEIQTEAQEKECSVSGQQCCLSDIYAALRELSAKIAEQSVELRYAKSQIEELKKQNEDLALEMRNLQARSNITESHVTFLRMDNEYKIAFSASLSTEIGITVGPFDKHFTLKYKNVFVNTGKAYNPHTGIFTAPVRGVYMFRFSINGQGSTSTPVGAQLFKNSDYMVIAYTHQASHTVTATNGASLLLEMGDVIYVQLFPKSQIRDNMNHYNTFSGQLLFTV